MPPPSVPPTVFPVPPPLLLQGTQSLVPAPLALFSLFPQVIYRVGPTSPWIYMAEQSQRALIPAMDPLYASSACMGYQAPAAPTFYPSLRNPRQSPSSTSSCCSSSSFASRAVSTRWSQVTSTRTKNPKWTISRVPRLSDPTVSRRFWQLRGSTIIFARDIQQSWLSPTFPTLVGVGLTKFGQGLPLASPCR